MKVSILLLIIALLGCGMSTPEQQASLVNHLRSAHPDYSPKAFKAMLVVDRGLFANGCPTPYQDSACAFNIDGQTISAPHMHLYALDRASKHVHWSSNPAILDIGCGSGYLTAAFHQLMKDESLKPKVVGIDRIEPIVTFARNNIQRERPDALASNEIILKVANGYEGEATSELGPYDVIHIGASTPPEVLHKLAGQLSPDGVIIVPEESKNYRQDHGQGSLLMRVYRRVGDDLVLIAGEDPLHVKYVPLQAK